MKTYGIELKKLLHNLIWFLYFFVRHKKHCILLDSCNKYISLNGRNLKKLR